MCQNEKVLHSVPLFTLRTLAFQGKFTHVVKRVVKSPLVFLHVRTGKRMDSNISLKQMFNVYTFSPPLAPFFMPTLS